MAQKVNQTQVCLCVASLLFSNLHFPGSPPHPHDYFPSWLVAIKELLSEVGVPEEKEGIAYHVDAWTFEYEVILAWLLAPDPFPSSVLSAQVCQHAHRPDIWRAFSPQPSTHPLSPQFTSINPRLLHSCT